jgi:hypothetical protein
LKRLADSEDNKTDLLEKKAKNASLKEKDT